MVHTENAKRPFGYDPSGATGEEPLSIGVICGYYGLTADGGPAGVGRAVNRAVVACLMAIFAVNVVFTQWFLAAHPDPPRTPWTDLALHSYYNDEVQLKAWLAELRSRMGEPHVSGVPPTNGAPFGRSSG